MMNDSNSTINVNSISELVTSSKNLVVAINMLNETLADGFPPFVAGQLPGTTTNGDATTGNVGQYVFSQVLSGAAVSLTTATSKTITSISLTGGDWNIWGNVGFVANAATTATIFEGGINSVDNTLPTPPGNGGYAQFAFAVGAGVTEPVFSVGMVRVPLNSTTTYYLVAQSTFAVNTMSAFGFLGARRAR